MAKSITHTMHMPKVIRLSLTTVVLINIAAVASLRSLPSSAIYGLSSIFYYIVPAILFFIPTALVSAELATGWRGGVFNWVNDAFGPRWGFLAIWLQWVQNVTWFPTILSFVAGALFYTINPALANNGFYTGIVILVCYWSATLISFRGLDLSSRVGSSCVIIGTIIPALLIVVLAVIYLARGGQSAMPLIPRALMPDLSDINNIVLVVGTFLAYAGIEMNANHAGEMDNPRKNYPKAVFFSALGIMSIFIFGTLAVALLIPANQISLNSGVIQAYSIFFERFGIGWLTPLMSFLLIFGALGGVITWIVGPSKGLLVAGRQGLLPPKLQQTNQFGGQTQILLIQGSLVTLLALLFIFLPSVNASYWILTTMTAQLYLLVYVLMFAAALRLRHTHPNVHRTYKVPAMPLIAGIGLLSSILGILIGFLPPSQFGTGNPVIYISILLAGMLFLGCPPLVIYAFKKPSWLVDPHTLNNPELKIT